MRQRAFAVVVLLVCEKLAVSSACYVETPGIRYPRVGTQEVAAEVDGQESDEKRLLRYLMRGYERDVRPVRNASTPITIQLSITLTQIFDMDEKNQVLTTIIWLDQEWKDELLTWNPEDFGGLKILRMPCERIWVPDIVLYNNADDYTRGYMNSKAMVSYDGNVFWPPPTKLRSTCPFDVTYFPFDDQTCILKFGSWTYDGFQVDVTNRTSEVDLTNYVPNGEWELLEARLVRNVVYYSCCPEPFPDLTVTLRIRRKTLYYLYNIVLPCVMMSVLTLLVFCLPPDSGEKIALGVTVLLAFSVFMLAIAEKMPETSESIPLIGIYLTAVMAITSISVVMTVIVLNFHYKTPESKPVPKWMRRYIKGANKTTPVVPAPNPSRPETSARNVFTANGKLTAQCEQGCCGLLSGRAPDSTTPQPPLRIAINAEERFNQLGRKIQDENFSSDPGTANNKQNILEPRSRELSTNAIPPDDENLSCYIINRRNFPEAARESYNGLFDEEKFAFCSVHKQNQHPEPNNTTVQDWRKIAAVVDRILFWIFCVITSISSLMFLIIIPGYKRDWFTGKL